jgi:hypothetical protein
VEIDYRQRNADYDVEALMYRRFPPGEQETERIKALLRQVIAWGDNLPGVLNRLEHERDINEYMFLSVMDGWCCEHCDLEWYLSNREEVVRKAEEDLRRLEEGKIRIIERGEYEELEQPAEDEGETAR